MTTAQSQQPEVIQPPTWLGDWPIKYACGMTSSTLNNTQQGSQYQGYLAQKTQSLTKWTCLYKIPSVPLCFDNLPTANHNQKGQCLGRLPNLAAIFWQIAQMYMTNLFRCSPAKQR